MHPVSSQPDCSHWLLQRRLGSLANPFVNVWGLHVTGGGRTPAEQIAGNTENEIQIGVSKSLPTQINFGICPLIIILQQ